MALVDSYNRKATYLRLAVTDKCNLRCRYCMPAEGIDFAERKDLMSYEEIIRLARIFAKNGVTKIRLTGGEPFVRKDMDILLEQLSTIIPSIHITTNATRIQNFIPLMKKINIAGLNISLDSLDRNKFHLITRRDNFQQVMDNIDGCAAANIPMKVNVVLMKGVNDDEIIDFILWGIDKQISVRFIEAMPFNDDDGNKDQFMDYTAILTKIKTEFPDVNRVENSMASSSIKYSIGGNYTFGLIPAYSRTLCGMCNRLRLTPKGILLTCLYSTTGKNLLELMRNGVDDKTLEQAILSAVYQKKKDGFEEEKERDSHIFESMTTIGG